jgi:hypothetical protein
MHIQPKKQPTHRFSVTTAPEALAAASSLPVVGIEERIVDPRPTSAGAQSCPAPADGLTGMLIDWSRNMNAKIENLGCHH